MFKIFFLVTMSRSLDLYFVDVSRPSHRTELVVTMPYAAMCRLCFKALVARFSHILQLDVVLLILSEHVNATWYISKKDFIHSDQ
jgi:hypothetical protein